jgi:hypothetical protein
MALLLCLTACCILIGIPTTSGLAFWVSETPVKISHPAVAGLTFADRVAYQRAIEEIYWRHRIWPKESPDPKPPLDAVISRAQLEKKVADYLRNSQELEDYWHRPVAPEQLQAEMDRMAKHTKQPRVLRELFAALGNDPFVIAECLARPVLTERLLTSQYAHDETTHRGPRRPAELALKADLPARSLANTSGAAQAEAGLQPLYGKKSRQSSRPSTQETKCPTLWRCQIVGIAFLR